MNNIIYWIISKTLAQVFFIDINKLLKIKKGCEDTIENCAICENQNVCEECEDGYFWNRSNCEGNFPIDSSIINNLSLRYN